jgi:hypothetical protein
VELVTKSITPARPEDGGFLDGMHVTEKGRGEEEEEKKVL